MSSVLWANTNRPALGLMSVTTLLTDNATDDTTTGETSVTNLTYGPGCAYHVIEAFLTAVWDFGSLYDLASWRFTSFMTVNPGMTECALAIEQRPPDGWTYDATLEVSSDGTSWSIIATLTLAGGVETRHAAFSTGAQARYVRLVAHTRLETWDASDSISATAKVTDFRVTATPAVGGCPRPDPPTLRAVSQLVNNVPQITILGNQ